MATCPNCGRQNAEIAKFCEQCGTALSPTAKEDPSWDPGKTIQSPRSVRPTTGDTPSSEADETRTMPEIRPAQGLGSSSTTSSEQTVVSRAAPVPPPSPTSNQPRKRRSKLPFILVGVVALLVVCCGGTAAVVYFSGASLGGIDLSRLTSSGNQWATSSSTTVGDVLNVDLSSFGLSKQAETDAKDTFNFEGASMTSGRMDIYSVKDNLDNPAVAVSALYYADKSVAAKDFQTFLDSPNQIGVSTKSINTINNTGSGKFEFDDSFERLQWSDNWIIHVVVVKSQIKDALGTRDKIWDKLQEHLKTLK